YQSMEEGKQVKKLPMTLGDALEALKKDEVIKSAMPGEMHRLYDEYKRDEWERFLHTSTEWDLNTYLNCLPSYRSRKAGSRALGPARYLGRYRRRKTYVRYRRP